MSKLRYLSVFLVSDVVQKYAPKAIVRCSHLKEGDVFITDGKKVPENFCVWAFSDIFKDIIMVQRNAECTAGPDKKCQVTSCTDGFRPVVFLIEPYDGEE